MTCPPIGAVRPAGADCDGPAQPLQKEWRSQITRQVAVGGVYNTTGMNDPAGTGDTSPQDVLDKVDVDDLKEGYDVLGAFKNGPRLWCLDWAEVMAGRERDFEGLKARWVMWLDVPKEMRKHESVAYKAISGKRDTQLGVSKGAMVFGLGRVDNIKQTPRG